MARRFSHILLALLVTQISTGCFFHGRLAARRQARHAGVGVMAAPVTITPGYQSASISIGTPTYASPAYGPMVPSFGGAGCSSCSQASPVLTGFPSHGISSYPSNGSMMSVPVISGPVMSGPVMSGQPMPTMPSMGTEIMPSPMPLKGAPATMPLSFAPTNAPLLLKPVSR